MKSKKTRQPIRHLLSRLGRRTRIGVVFVCIFVLPWLSSGCNDYPLRQMVAQSYVEITDVVSQGGGKKVDILFVVDNSGSMGEEQDKLKKNFEAFIEGLTKQDVNDYQIGVVSTDMSDPTHSGKLQGSPRIINGKSMSKRQVVSVFTKNVAVGTLGTSYEKALNAMKEALSPKMIKPGGPNAGFLRDGAVLAIIFIGDEDDCSNNGSFPETEYDSDVCRLPKSQFLKDPDTGDPILDSQNKPIKGQLETLTPTSTYINFLKGLKRTVVVGGIIGDPYVYKTGTKQPQVGCSTASKDKLACYRGTVKHRCSYVTPTQTKCGGCWSDDTGNLIVAPGFRLYDLIKEFGGPERWFPICGDDTGFNKALLDFVGLILEKINFIALTRPPLDTEAMSVQMILPDGNTRPIPAADPQNKPCGNDNQCKTTKDFSCGPPSDKNCPGDLKGKQCCYGEGWILFPPAPNQAKLKLSGDIKKVPAGSQIKVVYAAK